MCRIGLICIVWATSQALVFSCPFCEPLGPTLCEEVSQTSVAVFATSTGFTKTLGPVDAADRPAIFAAAEYQQFAVQAVLKEHPQRQISEVIDVSCIEQINEGDLFLITGYGDKQIEWSNPIRFSPEARDYLVQALEFPNPQTQRLAYFQSYLQHRDETIRRDAYSEFAKASYADLQELGSQMKREELLRWIADPDIPARDKRLYLTMLGVCGTTADVAQLEALVQTGQAGVGDAFDALVACYLTLHGPPGLEKVRQWYLSPPDADTASVYAVVTALRFHAEETDRFPLEKIADALRPLASRPDVADLVIMDFVRWEDWSLVQPLGELFPTLGEEHMWVRGPILTYLRACPLPAAKTLLADLKKLDPDSFSQAEAPWLALARKPEPPSASSTNPIAAASRSQEVPSRAEISWILWLGGVLGLGLFIWAVVPTTSWRWQKAASRG